MLMPVIPRRNAHEGRAAIRAPSSILSRIGAQALEAGKLQAWRFALGFFLFFPLLSGCSKPEPEQRLRATIAEMQKAAEDRDSGALFDHIADDFAASEGMDRDRFRGYVTVIMLRNQSIGLQMGPLDVKMIGDRARVSFTLAATGGSGRFVPDRAQVYEVETAWRQDGDDWELISASWKPAM
ncbi:hypothetical protein [Arenimonas sp.]|uniref:hypothetical protein n=1 Tax=Arenimonas sp. TaxID=1872635 RepID=UPI0039E60D53